jgi:hypothetical protein
MVRLGATFQPIVFHFFLSEQRWLIVVWSLLFRYCVSVFTSDGAGEAELFFHKAAAGVVGRQLMPLLHQRYPGHHSVGDISRVARHETGIPQEISRLVGQKYKLLVCISKKWKTSNSEDLCFQVCRIEETYKPELPPLAFAASMGSAGASSSASGSG